MTRADVFSRHAAGYHRRSADLASSPGRVAILQGLDPQPGDRLLDACCGPGTLTVPLARRVAPDGEVVGIDSSEAMLRCARADPDAERLPARYLRMDVADLDFPDHSFDAAACAHGLHLLADPLGALRELRRVLRPGRLLAASVPGPAVRDPVLALIEDFIQARVHDRARSLVPAAAVGDSCSMNGCDLPAGAASSRLDTIALAAGFRAASLRTVTSSRRWADAAALARNQLTWWSTAERLGNPGGRRLARLSAELASCLETHAGGPPYDLPTASVVLIARS